MALLGGITGVIIFIILAIACLVSMIISFTSSPFKEIAFWGWTTTVCFVISIVLLIAGVVGLFLNL